MPPSDRRSEDDASAQGRAVAGGPGPASHREVLLVALLLAAVTSVFFFDVVFMGRTLLTSPQVSPVVGRGRPGSGLQATRYAFNPYLVDPLASGAGHEPLFKKMNTLLRHGELPLWNSNSGLGRPLLGSSSPVDSPLRLPVLLWPNPPMWDAFLLARFLMAGLFTYLLARRLGIGPVGAAGAALAYPFTGYFMLRENMGHVDYAALIPVVLYAMELLVEARSAKRVAFAAAAFALGILADNPETAVILVVFAVTYYAARAFVESRGQSVADRTRRVFPLLWVLVIGGGLTAVALVPFLRLIGIIGQPLTPSYHLTAGVGGIASSFVRLVTFFLPFLRGAPLRGFHEHFTNLRDYTGVVMPMFALLALAHRPFIRKAGWFFVLALVVALAKLYGVPVVNWVGKVPPFRAIIFFRYLTPVVTFSMAMLAAGGIDRVARGVVRLWQPIAAAVALAALIAVLLVLAPEPLGVIPHRYVAAQLGFAAGLLVLAIGAAAVRRRRWVQAASVALVGLMVFELFVFSLPTKGEVTRVARIFYPDARMPIVQRAPRRDVYAEPRFVSFLKQDRSVYRVFGLDYVLRGNASAAYDLDSILDLNAVRLSRPQQFLSTLVLVPSDLRPAGQPPAQGRVAPVVISNPMFDLLNVKYVLTLKTDLATLAPDQYERVYDGEVLIFRNRDALPRAFMVHQVRTAPDAGGAMRLLEEGGVDPSEEAVVEGALPSGEASTLRGGAGGNSNVRITTYRDDRVEISVRTDRPGMLVLSDTYYPGWKATVDGAPAHLFATDGAFRSVYVTAGDHRVTFSYAPGAFKAGAAISALSLLALVAYAAWEAKRRVRSKGQPPDATLESPEGAPEGTEPVEAGTPGAGVPSPAGPDPPGPTTPGTSPAEEPPGRGPRGSDPQPATGPPA